MLDREGTVPASDDGSHGQEDGVPQGQGEALDTAVCTFHRYQLRALWEALNIVIGSGVGDYATRDTWRALRLAIRQGLDKPYEITTKRQQEAAPPPSPQGDEDMDDDPGEVVSDDGETEPSEAQLEYLNDTSRMSQREIQEAAWNQKRELDRR